MERLTEKADDGSNIIRGANDRYIAISYIREPDGVYFGNIVDRLAAYEDAEEQGRLVILPCKVGDMVWDRRGEPWTVISVEWFSRKVTQLHCKSPVTGRGMTFSLGKRSLGKTVFFTREEAEKALEGMK